ncbi:MAG: CinA family protein [Burkholderiaceae bacterium]|jgi:nicotinamide-nucleotide amidase|nr:CinA family protein [Burkholderiaceae bacterium]
MNLVPLAKTIDLITSLADVLLRRRWLLATAESCTGGLISAVCTSVAGSSDWFERGFVTYSNAAKTDQLGVPAELIAAYGAVSEPVARAMADGAIAYSRAQISVAVTGIAGPGGGSADKPVGTVCFGWNVGGQLDVETRRFDGDRTAVRAQTVEYALHRLLELLPSDGIVDVIGTNP